MFLSKGRKHSPEFKRGAIGQIRQPGVSCAQVARELGIASNLLTRWKRGSEVGGREAFDGVGKSTDEEVARLKRNWDVVTVRPRPIAPLFIRHNHRL